MHGQDTFSCFKNTLVTKIYVIVILAPYFMHLGILSNFAFNRSKTNDFNH